MSLHPPSLSITLDAALRDLAGGTDKARTLAAHALGDVTDATERRRAAEALALAARDAKPEVRTEVAISLGELEQAAAIPALVDLLDDGVPVVRQAAAIALGKLGLSDGFAPLADKLRSGPPDLRFQAATSLVEIDADAAFDPLLAALSDDDPEVLGAVAVALGACGDPRAAGHLSGLLEHKRTRTRFDAAYALAELGDDRGREVLVSALANGELAWDAIDALERLADDAAADALAGLAGPRRKVTLVHVRAADALLAVAPEHRSAEGARALLTSAATARKLEVAGLAVAAIARAGGDWARQVLEATRDTRRGRRLADEIDHALAELAEVVAEPSA